MARFLLWGSPSQLLTFVNALWHAFCYGRPYRFCYACAPVKLFHVEQCAPLHKINCFTWNILLNKVKRII